MHVCAMPFQHPFVCAMWAVLGLIPSLYEDGCFGIPKMAGVKPKGIVHACFR